MKSIGNRLKTWRQNTSKFLIPKYAREAASCHASREAAGGRFDGGRFSVCHSMQ